MPAYKPKETSCTAFLSRCKCSNLSPRFAKPISAEGIAPWVKLECVAGSGRIITVGNESSTIKKGSLKNSAVIKSFHYAFGGGPNASDEVTIEIFDEEGGDFEAFILDSWPKNRNMEITIQEAFSMRFEFGWTTTYCQAGTEVTNIGINSKEAAHVSPKNNYAMPTGIDIEFEQGKIKFTIHANWMPAIIKQATTDGVFGEVEGQDRDRIPLKQAIRMLFGMYHIGVLFLTRKNGHGARAAEEQFSEKFNIVPKMNVSGLYEWAFHGNYEDINGKRWGWQPNQRNPIEAASAWLQGYRTTNDKGFIIRTDNSVPGTPIIVFWESGEPNCNGEMDTSAPLDLNVGTYIVHGGACSPVIKFEPKITVFPPTIHPGSSISDSGGPPAAQKKPHSRICPTITGRGEGSSAPISDDIKHQFKDKAAEEQATSLEANEKAQLIHANAVTADLIIQGDPFYTKMLTLTNRYVTIIVINPFHLRGGDNQTPCGDYTVKPPCNPLFTNRNWLIEGVDHQMKEGSYHTILKLGLRAPGITMDQNVPLGGADSCGIDYLKGRLKP